MIFCVDIDNTINNLNHVWIDYINREYKTDYIYSDIKNWTFFDVLALFDKLDVYKFLEWDGFWRTTKVYPNAVKVLETLVENGHRVYLVTATDLFNPALKIKLTHTLGHFDASLINKENIIITQDKSIIDGDVLIDDKLETCQEWLSRGKMVCCPTQPWNKENELESNCYQLSMFDDEDDMNERWLDLFEELNERLKLNLKIN